MVTGAGVGKGNKDGKGTSDGSGVKPGVESVVAGVPAAG
jgi:hypothetical protein